MKLEPFHRDGRGAAQVSAAQALGPDAHAATPQAEARRRIDMAWQEADRCERRLKAMSDPTFRRLVARERDDWRVLAESRTAAYGLTVADLAEEIRALSRSVPQRPRALT